MTLSKELRIHFNYYLLDTIILDNVIATPWEYELLGGISARIEMIISLSKGVRGLNMDLIPS